jgi:cyclophilin family peptidyl-prolyl cis-trans isomerase
MKRYVIILTSVLFLFIVSCGNSKDKTGDQVVSIETEFGVIKLKLYDETPEHKENFLKLAEEGFYDGLLFHRVMQNFMIQGGDPDSRNAQKGIRLGGGSSGYTIPAEFVPKYFHKKGALAAARKGSSANPEKRSSGSQFYIVQGEVFSQGKLDTLEMMKNNSLKNELMKEELSKSNEELNVYMKNQDQAGFNLRVAEIREKVDSIFNAGQKFAFTDEQKEIYTTIGGYPSLDGEYTVFGEVIEGLDVLDQIAAVETDENNRPVKDIKMKVEISK